jgi:hypothetical protein
MHRTFKTYLSETLRIKLAGGNNDVKLEAFLRDYENGTEPHPFDRNMRMWNDSVGLEVSKFDRMIHISSIISFVKKNSGDASKALKWVCGLADKHGVKLSLIVHPIKNAGAKDGVDMTEAQLMAWYKREGFEVETGYSDHDEDVDSDEMIRFPKSGG